MGISLSVRPVDQQRRQLAERFYSKWYCVRSGVSVSARRIGSSMNRFYTNRSSHWEVFCEKDVLFCQVCILSNWLTCSGREGYFHRILFFFSIRTGLFYQKLRCFDARNKFRTVAILRIFNISTKHLDLLGCCKYLPASLLRIKKNAIIFPGSKQIPQKSTSVSQVKKVNLYQNSKFYKGDVSLSP